MKIKLKDGMNAWASGELVYVKGEVVDTDKRFAEELIATGYFEAVKAEPKKAEKAEEIKQ